MHSELNKMTSFTQPGGTAYWTKGQRRVSMDITLDLSGFQYPKNAKRQPQNERAQYTIYSCNASPSIFFQRWQLPHTICWKAVFHVILLLAFGSVYTGRVVIYVLVTAGIRFTSEPSHVVLTSPWISHIGGAAICHPALTKHRQSVDRETEKQDLEWNVSMWECVRVRTGRAISSLIALVKRWFMDATLSCCSGL